MRTLPRTAEADDRSVMPASASSDEFGFGGQPHRQARHLLHRTVVEVAGDPALLALGRIERALHQSFAFELARAHAADQDPRDRHHQQHQRHQGGHQDRQEGRGQLPPAVCDARGQLVGLEQQGCALALPVGVDPRVHLEQLAEVLLEPVLRLAQVRDVGHHAAVVDHLEFVLTEIVGRADQLGLIGVDDRAVAIPDLHPDDRVGLHRVERRPRPRRPGSRRHRSAGRRSRVAPRCARTVGELPGLGERLIGRGLAEPPGRP